MTINNHKKFFVLDPSEPTVLKPVFVSQNMEAELATIASKTRRSKSEVIRDLLIIGINAQIAKDLDETIEDLQTPLPEDLMHGHRVQLSTEIPLGLKKVLLHHSHAQTTGWHKLVGQLLIVGLQHSRLKKNNQ